MTDRTHVVTVDRVDSYSTVGTDAPLRWVHRCLVCRYTGPTPPPLPCPGPVCPDCGAGKHPNCDGTAWDADADDVTFCACSRSHFTAGHRPPQPVIDRGPGHASQTPAGGQA